MTERARYWRRHVDRWERSGLSQAAYCRRHRLKAVAFGWWKRKLALEAVHTPGRGASTNSVSSRSQGADFVEVGTLSLGMAAYEIILSRDLVIRLGADFDADKVSQLVAAVRTVC